MKTPREAAKNGLRMVKRLSFWFQKPGGRIFEQEEAEITEERQI
jgi:hypothetical protein